MTTNPVVKMMRSLSNRSFEDLKIVAENECINIPEQVSKVELITIIISARAGRDARESVYKMVREGDRQKYQLHTENDNYYLRLTDAQANVLQWCADNEINFYNAQFEAMGEIEWETP